MRSRTRSQFKGLSLMLVFMALVTPCWPLALTTFGKSNPTNNNNNNNNQNNENKQSGIVARECRSESECSGIKGTSCLKPIDEDEDSNKMRCLCGDYKPPVNGQCENKMKGVKVLCNHDDECTEGAQCMFGNSTTLPGRRCYCMQGFVEDSDRMCSGSPVAFGFSALSLVASLLLAGNA